MNPFSPIPEKTDGEEFSELLRCYGPMAYRMACQLTGGRESEAGDLVQEVFIKIWRFRAAARPASMKAWMYRVLRNLYLDGMRKKNRYPSVSIDALHEDGGSLEDILPDHRPSAENTLEKLETQKQVNEALAQLGEDFRIPIVLCDMEGLSYEDIAQIIGCPVGTVRSRIHRGRLQLRVLLKMAEPTEVRL